MTYEHMFLKDGELLGSNYLMSDVSLDEFDDNKVKLLLRPYYEDVELVIVYYNEFFEVDCMKGLLYFTLVCDYDKTHDKIEINIINGFDEFIFNICSILGIGRLTIDEDVKSDGGSLFAPIFEKVKSITLSLEEFKMLDGFVGKFSICNPSIDFLSMKIAIKGISERVGNGSDVPEVNSEYLLRGENVFL